MTRTRGGNLTHGCNYEKSKIVMKKIESSHKMERDTALCTMHREHSIHDIHVYPYVCTHMCTYDVHINMHICLCHAMDAYTHTNMSHIRDVMFI